MVTAKKLDIAFAVAVVLIGIFCAYTGDDLGVMGATIIAILAIDRMETKELLGAYDDRIE